MVRDHEVSYYLHTIIIMSIGTTVMINIQIQNVLIIFSIEYNQFLQYLFFYFSIHDKYFYTFNI